MFLFTLALAADALWWSEENVSRNSALFGKAQARDAEAYQRAQDQLESAKRAVGDLELGAAIVGGSAIDAYTETLDRQLSGQFLRLQKHADLLGEDYGRVFGDALESASKVVGAGQNITQCSATSRVEMLMGKSPKCPGTDVSAKLAASMDQDPKLIAAIAEILTIEWPAIEVKGTQQVASALTGTERSVDAASVARKLQKEALAALDDERDVGLEQLSEDLESTDPKVQAAAIEKAAAIRTEWRTQTQKIGTKVRVDLTKLLTKAAKKGGPAAVAICANPASLGGCGVPDVTRDVVALLAE